MKKTLETKLHAKFKNLSRANKCCENPVNFNKMLAIGDKILANAGTTAGYPQITVVVAFFSAERHFIVDQESDHGGFLKMFTMVQCQEKTVISRVLFYQSFCSHKFC